eukprot:2309520-Pyramimonas_sp.AAC.1
MGAPSSTVSSSRQLEDHVTLLRVRISIKLPEGDPWPDEDLAEHPSCRTHGEEVLVDDPLRARDLAREMLHPQLFCLGLQC